MRIRMIRMRAPNQHDKCMLHVVRIQVHMLPSGEGRMQARDTGYIQLYVSGAATDAFAEPDENMFVWG